MKKLRTDKKNKQQDKKWKQKEIVQLKENT